MDQLTFLQSILSTQTAELIAFYLIAVIAIILSVGVISDKNIIRSGFLLIGVFGGISGLFLLLQAQFLALAQVMIYAVGITLVVVIALMLTSPRTSREVEYEEETPEDEPAFVQMMTGLKRSFPGVVAWISFVTIWLAVRSETWPVVINQQVDTSKNLEVIGRSLTTVYSLPFEFASVLLLAALVGAIMLAKAERPEPTTGEGGE